MGVFSTLRTGAGLCALLVFALLGTGRAVADETPPLFDGSTQFPTIQDASGPEEFSWQVQLGANQGLRSLDDDHAEVFWLDSNLRAFAIDPAGAVDANGKLVPETLAVVGEDVITLTVHHRAGNPAAGGAAFQYPINPGVPFNIEEGTVVVVEPKQSLPPAPAPQPPVTTCVVPALRGLTLSAASRRLRRSDCKLGAVKRRVKPDSRSGRVVIQAAKVGTSRSAGFPVNVTLAA